MTVGEEGIAYAADCPEIERESFESVPVLFANQKHGLSEALLFLVSEQARVGFEIVERVVIQSDPTQGSEAQRSSRANFAHSFEPTVTNCSHKAGMLLPLK